MQFVKNYQEKVNFSELEKKVLDFWDKNKIFEKSVEKNPKSRSFVFYDGPPFATGLPHYGHILGSTAKDVVPRYFTMRGYRVERVWGWDCHGLPIENLIEQELKLKGGKRGIEELGIEKFNQACRASVFRYDKEWRKVIRRVGRWVDMENSYKTLDNTYIESVWWAFGKLYDKGLIYEGRHVILYCPRCATPLSNFEIAMDNSYQDVTETSVYVKFKLVSKKSAYILAWTTTPWTLPGNVGLAVDESLDYAEVKAGDETYYLAKSRLSILPKGYKLLRTLKGKDLVGLGYEPLYNYLPIGDKKAYYVFSSDFVSMEEGTGVVHTAAIYGEDDYKAALKMDLPTVPMLDDQGRFQNFVTLVSGKFFKEANPIIIEDLKQRELLLKDEMTTHSYPFCYRCDTPLYYNAVPAWFINIQKIKPKLIKENEKINWFPGHFKHGQFKNILESSPDWNISRSRYWGSPMPVWICSKCGLKEIVGSVSEMRERAVDKSLVDKLKDLHRPYIDEILLKCKCGGEMKRIPEVFDCWIESASMPFASLHYPFENREKFEENYPAQFIAEYVGQVRAWFNVLHRISVALFEKPSFLNVVVTGVYLGTDGKKLSKSRKNYPDPALVFERYGVDSLRFYMMSTSVMRAENVIINEKDVDEVYKKVINIFWNVFSFYKLYSKSDVVKENSSDLMDKWLLSRINSTVRDVTRYMDLYDVVSSCRALQAFIDDFSTWYLRRSRERIRESLISQGIMAYSLINLSKMLAPIAPFISEVAFKELTSQESVHLSEWPSFDARKIDKKLEEEMAFVRIVSEKGHAKRREEGIKVRQPLTLLKIASSKGKLTPALLEVIKDELNVKDVKIKTQKTDLITVELDTKLNEELLLEGSAREFIRSIQSLRKVMGVSLDKFIELEYEKNNETDIMLKRFGEYVKSKAKVKAFIKGSKLRIRS
ncbi:hypothetical protein A2716_03385 [candidate division WWE3 bacterium RIFCSPHIGHO2_01_FULL_40_23]|uniref:Isoleucine--tRNA ligase n=1 Tax=candidate division WWE3 bacterium RIFCSPLOWO2_01_FULL_41_18 TaxID=1802625 RepID=A0A1F4VE02_UNCKA|nr:MAG: hypothetical protein A2716_03385 [candidate division WWE3 bacterium RIFCSPHIGHO2_01_FULL_40_23]OGC54923.1 MAG: hypothetical protein A3A78_02995 [candidate division WWE3 bacterium RIFCSPLOWO2_01_FULL_41_18]